MKRIKSFQEISKQCERIFTLYIKYNCGTERMFAFCEEVYFKLLNQYGY